MAQSDGLEKGEASKTRSVAMENVAKCERAEKKPRLSRTNLVSSRKRPWSEVTETDMNLKDSLDSSMDARNSSSSSPSRKLIRIRSKKKKDGKGDKLMEDSGTRKSRDSEPNMVESGSKLWEMSDVQKHQLLQKKWKRMSNNPNSGGLKHEKGSSFRKLKGAPSSSCDRQDFVKNDFGTGSAVEGERMGKQKQIRAQGMVREVFQTSHLEEKSIAGEKETINAHDEGCTHLEDDSALIVSSLEQTALNGRDKKRRGVGNGDASPPWQPVKKLRIDVAVGGASSRSGEQGVGVSLANTSTWKRLKRQNTKSTTAASEDMGVSVSEAWKRLREEKEGNESSGSSVNGRSDCDLSMDSSDSEEERSKKARHDLPDERKWTRKSKVNESCSSKRLREGSDSDVAQSSYLYNRQWKRPRFEDMMSVQSRSRRKQTRDGEEARVSSRESSRKRVQGHPHEKSRKRQRK